MSRRTHALPLAVLLFVAAACTVACKDETRKDQQGTPPPPPPAGSGSSAGKSLCDPAATGVSDAKVAALVPAVIGGFCVLKLDAVRSFGEGGGKKIEDLAGLIDGAAEIYTANYFAKRYDSLKFVHGKGTDAAVDVAVSTFDKPENAYGLFTYRLVANADPDPAAMKKASRRPWQALKGGGAAALGNGAALLWKGNYLVELTYSPDSTKTMAEATAEGDVVLPKMVEAMAEKMVGTTDLPADVRALPTEAEGRVPLGIDYVPPKFARPEGKGDALKISVAGGYATAFMREGDKRFRVIAVAREERDAGRDAFSAFSRLPGALPLKDKDFGDDAVHFAFAVGAGGAGAAGKAEGVAVRKGALVLALTDEELAMGDPAVKTGFPRLTKEEKIAKLRKLLDARAAGIPGPAAPSTSGSASASASAVPSSSASAPSSSSAK